MTAEQTTPCPSWCTGHLDVAWTFHTHNIPVAEGIIVELNGTSDGPTVDVNDFRDGTLSLDEGRKLANALLEAVDLAEADRDRTPTALEQAQARVRELRLKNLIYGTTSTLCGLFGSSWQHAETIEAILSQVVADSLAVAETARTQAEIRRLFEEVTK